MQKNLKSKPAILNSYSQFKIYEPKERLISVVPFIDRVMHHAIMNILEPIYLVLKKAYPCDLYL